MPGKGPGNRGHLRLAGLGGVGSELQVCSKLASNGAQSQYTRPPEMGSASRGQCGSAIVCQWRYGGLQSGSLNRTPPGAVLMQNKGAP
jgi:hypothetical protein